jgi:hypothetical protein
MSHFRIFALLLSVLLAACGPKPTAIATPPPIPTIPPETPAPPDPNDPAEIQRRFVEIINDAIKKAEPGLKRPITKTLSKDEPHSYFAEYTGKLAYDIRKTDSIVTPYLGTVSWSIRWYHNGVSTNMPMTLDAHYAYQQGQWILKDLVRNVGDKNLPADEYFPLFR